MILLTGVLMSAPVIAQDAGDLADNPPAGVTIHVVQRGENLYSIAIQYEMTVQDLAELNGIFNPYTIYVGQRLLVPTDETITIEPQTHIVQPGQNLFDIATVYGTTIDTLLNLNDIANANTIYVGQVLQITERRTIGSTDTPIADESVEATPETEVTPETTPEAVEVAEVAPTEIPTFSTNIHVVQGGDTMYKIAVRYGTTVQALSNANAIADPTRIYSGQRLIIPGRAEPEDIARFPEPIESLDINPLVLVEGETTSITIRTNAASLVTVNFLEQNLRVISLENNGLHYIFVPVPLFTPPDTYLMTMRFNVNGVTSEYQFNLRVAAGAYGTSYLTVAAENLLQPAVQDAEVTLLTNLTRTFTEQRLWDTSLSIPAAAAMNAPYGTRRSYNGGPVDGYHSGADFASAPGAPIYSAASGQVVLADALNIRGNTVVVNHGWGIYTLYAHLSQINVGVGEMVDTGQVLGLAGSTGRVTGPHLHWEVWVNGVPVNPLQWVRRSFP